MHEVTRIYLQMKKVKLKYFEWFIAVPRIIVIGPPAAGKGTIASMICKTLGTVHVTLESVMKKGSSSLVSVAEEYSTCDVPVPIDMWAGLVQSRSIYHCYYQLET